MDGLCCVLVLSRSDGSYARKSKLHACAHVEFDTGCLTYEHGRVDCGRLIYRRYNHVVDLLDYV